MSRTFSRTLTVTVTDEFGNVLDAQSLRVADGVSQLHVTSENGPAAFLLVGTGGTGMNRADRIEKIVRDWDQWSRAERERIEDVVAEVLDHCRNGTGNRFIANWCNRFIPKNV